MSALRNPRSNRKIPAILLLLAVACLASSAATLAQPVPVTPADTARATWAAFPIEGRVNEVSVAPDGRVWLASAAGHTYFADRIDGSWARGSLYNEAENFLDRIGGDQLDRITFFNPDTAIATGYIDGGQEQGKSYLYRTLDGGTRWELVSHEASQWIYDAFVLPDGKAWIGGSSGILSYSSDYGQTWSKQSAPFDNADRLHAIYMRPGGLGVIGALRNAIKQTQDHGLTWTDLPTPLDQGVADSERGEDRIEELALYHDFIIAAQGGQVWYSRLDTIRWQELADVVRFAVRAGEAELVGLSAAGEVFRYDTDLHRTPLTSQPLPTVPIHLAVTGSGVYGIDVNGGLYEINEEGWKFSYPLTNAMPLEAVGRISKYQKVWWGASPFHLYQSTDEGKTWSRFAVLHTPMRGMAVLNDTEALLWDWHGNNLHINRQTGAFERADDFGQDDVIDVIQGRDVWVAYGGMQYETTYRVEVAQTFYGGQFRGSRPHGFVYVSRDRGQRWEKVDTWEEAGVAALYLLPNGDMRLLSYLGAIRHLERTKDGYRGTTVLAATEENLQEVPYVQRAHAFYFSSPSTGYISGWIHHMGTFYYQTNDGGRHWFELPEKSFPYHELRQQGPYTVALTNDTVYLLEGNTRELLYHRDETQAADAFHVASLSFFGAQLLRVLLVKRDPEDPYVSELRWVEVALPAR